MEFSILHLVPIHLQRFPLMQIILQKKRVKKT